MGLYEYARGEGGGTVLPMREPSIFRGIAISLLWPVIGSNVEIDVIALNWFAHVRKQFAAEFK